MAAMLEAVIALLSVAAAPFQDAVPERVRERVIEALDASTQPMSYEFRRQIYYVDYGCALGSRLAGHVDGTSDVTRDLVTGLLEFIEECADAVDRPSAVLAETGGERIRVTAAGDRYLEESIDPDGSVAHATIRAGERKAEYDAQKDSLRLGTTKDRELFTDPVEWLWPLPVGGDWKPAFERSPWIRPDEDAPGHLVAPIERQGRRIDLHIDFPVEDARSVDEGSALPTRARAETPGGPRSSSNRAAQIILLAWATDGPKPFITDLLDVELQEDLIRVTHVERSDPLFDVEEADVTLTVRRPKSVSIARNTDWSAFRRREILPVAWRDLVTIEE